MNALQGIGVVDAVFLAIVVVSMIVGLVRGFMFEVLSLAGWLVAYIAAQLFTPWTAAWLPVGEPGSLLKHGAAFVCTFVAALVVWGLASRLMRMLIRSTPLSGVDRMLGAGFGFLRALVVLLAIATVVALSPASSSPAWAQSQAAPWLHQALATIRPLLPAGVSERIRA